MTSSLALSVSTWDGAENLHWVLEGRWVVRFAEPWTAEQVTRSLGLERVVEPPEVALPDAVADLAVSEHFDVAEGIPEFITATDPIVELRSGLSEPSE